MIFTVLVVLDAAYYRVHANLRARSPRLCSPLNNILGDGLGRLFRLLPSLLRSTERFETENAVRRSCYSTGCAEVVLHRM